MGLALLPSMAAAQNIGIVTPNVSSLSSLPSIANNTVLGNTSGSTAAPSALTTVPTGAMPETAAHEGSFSVTTSVTLASITGFSQSLAASATYSCNGFMHFTTAPTVSNGVKLALATSDTLTVTTLNFTAIGLNAAAFATSGVGTATALGSTAIASSNVFTDILLQAEIVVNAAGTLQLQIAENASSGTIAGNARWDCHRAS